MMVSKTEPVEPVLTTMEVFHLMIYNYLSQMFQIAGNKILYAVNQSSQHFKH
ncbi:hypothetical protein THIOSC15_3030004 [uncultured Thiomicrorhabdus sp.]